MASQFGAAVQAQRAELISRLIQHFCELQRDDENYKIASVYCDYHTKHHTYADTDPWEVDEEYRLLMQRFGISAQLGKQQALDMLLQRLKEVQVASRTRDYLPRVLRMLLHLAQQPLQSTYSLEEARAAVARADAIRARAAGMAGPSTGGDEHDEEDYEEEGLSSQSEGDESDGGGGGESSAAAARRRARGAEGDGSDLSDWGSDGEEADAAAHAASAAADAGLPQRAAAPMRPMALLALSAGESRREWEEAEAQREAEAAAARAAAASTAAADAAAAAAAARGRFHDASSYDSGSDGEDFGYDSRFRAGEAPRPPVADEASHLLSTLLKATSDGGGGAGSPSHGPSVRVTEGLLVREALRALQGYPGRFLLSVSADPELARLDHLSVGALSNLLGAVQRAARRGAQLDAFVAAAADAVAAGGAPQHAAAQAGGAAGAARPMAPFGCATLRAFAAALGAQLAEARRVTLAEIEERTRPDGELSVSLIELAHAARRLDVRCRVLARLRKAAAPRPGAAPTAAEAAAACLNALASALSDAEHGHGAAGSAVEIAVGASRGAVFSPWHTLLALFASSLRPLLEALDGWLADGQLADPFGEFPVAPASAAGRALVDPGAFWAEGFAVRRCAPPEAAGPSRGGTPLRTPLRFSQRYPGVGGAPPQPPPPEATPSFLADLLPQIVSAGKASLLLREAATSAAQMPKSRPGREWVDPTAFSAAAAASALSGGAAPDPRPVPLHAHFCAMALRILERHEGLASGSAGRAAHGAASAAGSGRKQQQAQQGQRQGAANDDLRLPGRRLAPVEPSLPPLFGPVWRQRADFDAPAPQPQETQPPPPATPAASAGPRTPRVSAAASSASKGPGAAASPAAAAAAAAAADAEERALVVPGTPSRLSVRSSRRKSSRKPEEGGGGGGESASSAGPTDESAGEEEPAVSVRPYEPVGRGWLFGGGDGDAAGRPADALALLQRPMGAPDAPTPGPRPAQRLGGGGGAGAAAGAAAFSFGEEDTESALLAWLAAPPAASPAPPPPTSVLIEAALRLEIRSRAAARNLRLVHSLVPSHKLRAAGANASPGGGSAGSPPVSADMLRELESVRAVFLCAAGDFAAKFASELARRAEAAEAERGRTPAGFVSAAEWYEASAALEEALSECSQTNSALPPPGRLSIVVSAAASASATVAAAAAAAAAAQRSPPPRTPQGRGPAEPRPESPGAASGSGGQAAEALPLLRPGMSLGYDVPWPLSLVLDSACLEKYNSVFAFLLQIRRALSSLELAAASTWKRRRNPAAATPGDDSRRSSSATWGGRDSEVGASPSLADLAAGGESWGAKAAGGGAGGGGVDAGDAAVVEAAEALIAMELRHFIGSLQSHLYERVLLPEWAAFTEALKKTPDMDSLRELHEAFLSSVQRQCMAAPDPLWTLLASRVRQILALAVELGALSRRARARGSSVAWAQAQAEWAEGVERISRQFHENLSYVMRVLNAKLRAGGNAHLEDLVTRLNYNGFYSGLGGNASGEAADA